MGLNEILPARTEVVRDIELDQKEVTPVADAQAGVQKIEAITLTWSKPSLYAALVLIWLLTLVNGMRGSILASLTPYITSAWQSHSLLTVIGIVANALSAAVYIPMAKILDVWGRAEGFLIMTFFCVLGLVLMAASKNLPMYCAADVFYTIGFSGLGYTWDVLATDVTNLRNRGLAFVFTSSPAIITALAGSRAAQSFVTNVTWRWGVGCWAIVLPAFALPIYALLKYNQIKAKKTGVYIEENGLRRNFKSVITFLAVEMDLPGVLLFAGGLTVFLLPFTLASSAHDGWRSGHIIAMIVVGFVALVVFGLYESFLAPKPFPNGHYLADRTVMGACLLDFVYQVSYYCYALYFTSFLQVVYDLDVAEAGYVANTFSAVSFVFLFLAGYLIRITGRFKWILYICVPLYIFSLGLMIHFRTPNGYIGYVVMCEIFFSVAGSIFILVVQLAVLAAVDHQHVAAVLSLLFVTGTVGDAVGNTVSGVIWTNTFKKALTRNLPASAQPRLATIYGSLPAQLSYAVGIPERLGIQRAYGYTQTRMLAAATAIMVVGFVCTAMMRNLNVKKMTQTRGNVL
ncbi:siderochrome-iron transporter MirB [Niveomyces insectorum RCEF 264]|uniref:Siderochrome-iron transporter MirB n=1 Tax=Niveomyces insectorum RCEF 264 TaxID=1081102 RepID=A0A167P461_9HYPO|nr:siderochrome-iron transporter MirB [Niveomyces insectorum RCEF 264]